MNRHEAQVRFCFFPLLRRSVNFRIPDNNVPRICHKRTVNKRELHFVPQASFLGREFNFFCKKNVVQSVLDTKVCLYWATTDKIKLTPRRTIQLKT